jgi:hypothetical protein
MTSAAAISKAEHEWTVSFFLNDSVIKKSTVVIQNV